ncbi:MAG: response regulator transcription factor [Chitinophagaceae bacterium]|nr:response regulator transcription factor [Chitinophagaceae bacterium]
MAKILIVDDNADVLHVMQLLLSSRGFEIEVTTKGEETVNLVNTFHPELIFLDIHLSGLDGRDISRQLKTTEETKHIPVILFSANVIKGAMLEESLADEFIAKPFDIHELLLKVNKLIGSTDNAESMIA